MYNLHYNYILTVDFDNVILTRKLAHVIKLKQEKMFNNFDCSSYLYFGEYRLYLS